MTCSHVSGLIDAGPFVDYPHDHREAAQVHARQCATCGPALEAAEAVATSLQMIPNPALPRDLTAGVLARAAAVEQARRAGPTTATVGVGVLSRSLWVPASATALAAAAVAAAIASSDVALLRVGPFSGGGLDMPSTGAGMFQLLAGLALYALGLLVPLRSGVRRFPES